MRVAEHVHWRRIDTELIVLDLGVGEYFGLSEVAGVVFEGLAGGETEAQIVARLRNVYDVDPGQLVADVRRITDELTSKGLFVSC